MNRSTHDRQLALRAHKMSMVSGTSAKVIGMALKITTTEAKILIDVGRSYAAIEAAQLTTAETLLLTSIAEVHRRNLARGVSRSPESKEVAWQARKGNGWPSATARKRLFASRREDDGRMVHGLGLVDIAGNGYANLTPAGWALIHSMEASARAAEERIAPLLRNARADLRALDIAARPTPVYRA